MKPLLSEADHARVAQAIQAAEAGTSVELRAVLAHWSSQYGAFALIYPAMAALLAGGIIAAIVPDLGAAWLFLPQAAIFLALLALMQRHGLRRLLVPPHVRRKAAWRHARLHYAAIGLKEPHTRSALLLFCSAAERTVEILVDDAIAEQLPAACWEPVIARFKAHFVDGRMADAYVDAVAACGQILAPLFPPQPGQGNELPDDLVEIT